MERRHFNKFPLEVLCKIMSYLDNQHLVKMRHVSKEWRERVDTLGSFRISFRRPRFEPRHLNSVRIHHLVLCNYDYKKLPLFVFPNLVQVLTVDGDCAIEALRKGLGTFKYLTSISFVEPFWLGRRDMHWTAVEMMNSFQNLTSLHIDVSRGINLADDSEGLFQSMANSKITLRRLRHFSICYKFSPQTLDLYFEFLLRHRATLEVIHVECYRRNRILIPSELRVPQNLNQFGKLVDLKIICKPQYTFPKEMFLVWWSLALLTNSFERLTLELDAISLPKLATLIFPRKTSLKVLDVRNIVVSSASPYLLEGLDELEYLEELALEFIPHSHSSFAIGFNRFQPYHQPCFRQDYPKTLTRLVLKGANIMKGELVRSLKSLDGLRYLELDRLGSHIDFSCGLDHTGLLALLKALPNLQDLVMNGMSQHINFSYDVDKECWNRILRSAFRHKFWKGWKGVVMNDTKCFGLMLFGGKKVHFQFNNQSRESFLRDLISIGRAYENCFDSCDTV